MNKYLVILLVFFYIGGLQMQPVMARGFSVLDTTDSLLRTAVELMESDPDKARTLIDEALSLSESADLQKNIATALNYKGLSYYGEQNYEEAVKYFQQSLKVLFRIGDKKKIANMMKKIGLAYLNQRKYNRAIEYYGFAQKIFEQLKYIDRKAETHVEIGIIYNLSNRYASAIQEFDDALQLYQVLDNKTGQVESLHNMAIAYHKYGNYKKAQESFIASIQIYETYLDYTGLSKVLNDYANVLIDVKDYKKALGVLESAKEKINRNDAYLYSEVLANYGTVLIYDGELDLAENHLNQALEIADSLAVDDIQAKVYRALYELHFRKNDTRSALSYYQKYIAVKDTVSSVVTSESTNSGNSQHLNNLIIFITVFAFLSIVGLIIWLVSVIRQRDRAMEELKRLKNS